MSAKPFADPAIPTTPDMGVVGAAASTLGVETASSRIYGLDILRALAITDVVVQHGSNLLPPGPAAAVGALNLD